MQIIESGTPKNMTASAAVSLRPGTLIGFYVASTTAGTLVISDSTDGTSGNISGTITPAVGFHEFRAYCVTGCYFTIANTINVTAFFAAG